MTTTLLASCEARWLREAITWAAVSGAPAEAVEALSADDPTDGILGHLIGAHTARGRLGELATYRTHRYHAAAILCQLGVDPSAADDLISLALGEDEQAEDAEAAYRND